MRRLMDAMGRGPSSADRLREMLALNGDALRMYQGETLFHVQTDWTCQLLDVVDEVTDPVTAMLITDTIYERLTGDGVSEAAKRQQDTMAEIERMAREKWKGLLP